MTEENKKPLTKQEILKILKQDLTNSESFKSEWDTKRENYHNEWAGKKYGNEVKGKSQVVSRDIKSAQTWQHASLKDPFVNSTDGVKVTPVGAEDTPLNEQTASVLNYQYSRQFKRYKFITSALKVFQVEGTVVARVFWDLKEKEVEVEEPIMEMMPPPEMLQRMQQAQQAVQAGQMDPMQFQQMQQEIQQNLQPTQVGVKKVIKKVKVSNNPNARVCKNTDIWTDPTEKEDIENAQFVIERFKSNMSSLRQNPLYSNLDKIKIEDSEDYNEYDELYDNDGSFVFTDDARKELDVYEYWGNFDLYNTGIAIPIVCAWVGNTVIRLEESPYSDGKVPFVSCAFDPEPFSINGEANGELLSTDQKLRTAIKRSFVDTLDKSTNGQRGFQSGTLDPVNMSRFKNGKDFEFQGQNPNIWEGRYTDFNSSVVNFYQMLGGEMQSNTGVRPFAGGQSNGVLQSAKQVGAAMDAVGKREVDISRNFAENFIKPMLIKWHSMNNDFLEAEDIERITNKPYVPHDPVDIDGNMDIRIQVNTAETDAEKSRELAFLQQTMGPNDDPKVSRRIRAEMFKLKQMPELAQWILEYEPQPDPMAIKKAELEIQELEASIQEKQSRAQENMVDIELKKAKTVVEKAKARQLHTGADITDLDYVRTQTGEKHREAVDMENVKARNEIIKERSKPPKQNTV
jgi:hypothetical protein